MCGGRATNALINRKPSGLRS